MGSSVGKLIPNEIKDLAGDVTKLTSLGGIKELDPFRDVFPTALNQDVHAAAGAAGGTLLGAEAVGALNGPSAAASAPSATGGATPWLSNAPQGSVFAAPGPAPIGPSAAGSEFITGAGSATGAQFPWLSNAPAGSVLAANSQPFSVQAANALRIPAPAPSAPGGAQTPASAQGGLRTPPPPGSTPTTPAGTNPPPAGGGGFVDNLLRQMKDNALGLGLIGGSMLLAGKTPDMPSQAQLQGLSGEAQATANQLLAQYRSGQLNASQQAGLDQLTQQTKNQITQYFASIGQSDSTAHQQALAQVDQQAFGMRQQMLDNMLTQGLNAIGIASGPLQTIAQYQLGQDQALRQAYGNFAQGVGTLFGRQAGTQQPQPAPKPPNPQPTGTVQSAAQ